jgi:hypothetical protein
MRYYAKVAAVLIGLYLVVNNGTNSGSLITKGAAGIDTDVKAFQGR